MKVAVVSPYAIDQPGGVQDQVIEISNRLLERGFDSWVIAPGHSGPPGARLLGGSITVPANGSRAPVALNPKVMRLVMEAIEGADVVHLHEPLMPLVGWSLLRNRTTPMVGTFHADPSRFLRSVYRRSSPIVRRLTNRLTRTTAVSEVAASAVRPFRPEVEVIPNALDVGRYRDGAAKDPRRLVFLGRDEPRKGLDVLLAAWPTVKRAVPDASLDVIGATRKQTVSGVRFLGRVDAAEKRRILAGAAMFVAPNLGGESFGITLLEGMAAGCAVVASDLPAFVAVGGSAASFFRRGDADALAQEVMRLLANERSLAKAADQAKARSELFDWATVLPAYIETYKSALRGS